MWLCGWKYLCIIQLLPDNNFKWATFCFVFHSGAHCTNLINMIQNMICKGCYECIEWNMCTIQQISQIYSFHSQKHCSMWWFVSSQPAWKCCWTFENYVWIWIKRCMFMDFMRSSEGTGILFFKSDLSVVQPL